MHREWKAYAIFIDVAVEPGLGLTQGIGGVGVVQRRGGDDQRVEPGGKLFDALDHAGRGDGTQRGVPPRRGLFRDRGNLDAERLQRGQIGAFGDGAEADQSDAADRGQRPRLRLTASMDSASSERPRRASVSPMMSGGLMRKDGL